jgi:hypothetical protein
MEVQVALVVQEQLMVAPEAEAEAKAEAKTQVLEVLEAFLDMEDQKILMEMMAIKAMAEVVCQQVLLKQKAKMKQQQQL